MRILFNSLFTFFQHILNYGFRFLFFKSRWLYPCLMGIILFSSGLLSVSISPLVFSNKSYIIDEVFQSNCLMCKWTYISLLNKVPEELCRKYITKGYFLNYVLWYCAQYAGVLYLSLLRTVTMIVGPFPVSVHQSIVYCQSCYHSVQHPLTIWPMCLQARKKRRSGSCKNGSCWWTRRTLWSGARCSSIYCKYIANVLAVYALSDDWSLISIGKIWVIMYPAVRIWH